MVEDALNKVPNKHCPSPVCCHVLGPCAWHPSIHPTEPIPKTKPTGLAPRRRGDQRERPLRPALRRAARQPPQQSAGDHPLAAEPAQGHQLAGRAYVYVCVFGVASGGRGGLLPSWFTFLKKISRFHPIHPNKNQTTHIQGLNHNFTRYAFPLLLAGLFLGPPDRDHNVFLQVGFRGDLGFLPVLCARVLCTCT